MGKARAGVKRVKHYSYKTDRKKLWKKSKQLPNIKCTEIKAAWNPKKSAEANMKSMGLTSDSNRSMKIDETKDRIIPNSVTKTGEEDASGDALMSGPVVADLLETNASSDKKSSMKLSEPEAQFCISMIEKYGMDFKAMARDSNNYYQETAKQIRRKISLFRRFPGSHADFLIQKGLSQMETD